MRFLTGNAGKVRELQQLLGAEWQVEPDDRGYPEIQADSLEAVGRHGAAWLLNAGVTPPFVLEDSGLTIEALGGFPGAYSRYALDNLGNAGVLRLMRGQSNRSAAFETALVYVDDDANVHVFHGRCAGQITHAARGEDGFGFDPIFVPAGRTHTFAEMETAEKGALSHRGQAVRAFAASIANERD